MAGNNAQFNVYLKIIVTIFLALCFMLTPFPIDFKFVRPEILMMVIVYWVLAAPHFVGVGTAWIVGLLQDIFGGGILLGQNALALAVVAFLSQNLRHRLRLFAYWQQAFSILALVGLGQLIILVVQWLCGKPASSLLYWVPSLVSVVVWPILVKMMKHAIKAT